MSRKYPKEFEKYWRRANTGVNFNGEQWKQGRVKRIAYNAWRNGRKIKEHDLWRARSNGAFAYLFDKKIAEAVDSVMQKMKDELELYAAQSAEKHWIDDGYL